MQLVRLTFQKSHNWFDKDILLSVRLLGLKKIFEICRHAILVVENKMLLRMSALKIVFAWIHLACNVGSCLSLYCTLLKINPNPIYFNCSQSVFSWWTPNVVFPKWECHCFQVKPQAGDNSFPGCGGEGFMSSLWRCACMVWLHFSSWSQGRAAVKLVPPGLAVVRWWPGRADAVFAIVSSAAWSQARQHHGKS